MTRFRLVLGCLSMVFVIAAACDDGSTDDVKKYNPDGDDAGRDATSADADVEDAPTSLPLCEKMGGYAGVQGVAQGALTRLKADCRIGPWFTNLDADAQQHLAECFETFLASSAECKNGGNPILYNGSKDSRGVACRSMRIAHQNMGLSRDDQRAFTEGVIGAMSDKGIGVEARQGMLSILNGTQGVYNQNKLGNTQCAAQCTNCVYADAGRDGDAARDVNTDGANDAASDADGD
jgi:hypothetical protein